MPMEKHIKAILTALGEDTEREGLKNTPLRVSKSLRYLTSGSRESLDDILNGAVFRSTMEEMIEH